MNQWYTTSTHYIMQDATHFMGEKIHLHINGQVCINFTNQLIIMSCTISLHSHILSFSCWFLCFTRCSQPLTCDCIVALYRQDCTLLCSCCMCGSCYSLYLCFLVHVCIYVMCTPGREKSKQKKRQAKRSFQWHEFRSQTVQKMWIVYINCIQCWQIYLTTLKPKSFS